ncbi:CoA-acylating methylmalonate-semialdehyde dehydrogenase [Scopulibacillus cellulosilyticus]|uniref:CoA-acylating methylmalonate-semialdehyde dehydrogenase n=1 Tax=Scopulibacillus cellulosilyticus TaxID=2665665 RepID=A0ABW2PX75_9BACL
MTKIQNNVKTLTHFIGGEMTEGKSGRTSNIYSPSFGEIIGLCPLASTEEVNEAVEAAHAAFKKWKRISVGKRVQIIHRFRSLLVEKTDQLAEMIGLESGKTIADAKGEIGRGIESVDLALNAPHLLKGEYSVNVGGEINSFSMKQPLGVVAAISPFNFPAMVPLAMTSMAIAVGNAVILKPSEKVPNSALFLSELWKEAGLPDGVWTVINGDKEAVDAILHNPKIHAISFVGSTKVAEYVYHEGTRHNKRVASFGGGKNHMVIMPDANIDQAVTAFLGAAYGAASQRCMAISVAMPVGEKTAEAFVAKLKEKVQELKVGSYNDENADFGAVITQESKDTVIKYIDESLEEGAHLCIDGRHTQSEKGFYLGPTFLDHVTPDMKIYQEEVFGPARIAVRVNTLDEAINLINEHEYGNGVTIFTNNGPAARKFTEEIEVGMVGVNVPIPIPVGYHNFGGLKRSKFGDGHMFGPDTARFFTKTKTISERWPEAKDIGLKTEFSFPSNQ